jgi:DNA sulfur modification protein DndD
MFINQIELTNFRVYKGKNTLDFSVDQDSNITVIAGNNGFGKTSFLTSLVWALYGKLMVDVDDRYRQDISESGGYRRYCEKLMNRLSFSEAVDKTRVLEEEFTGVNYIQREHLQLEIDQVTSFSVALRFSNLMIPSVQCRELEVKRSYNVLNHKEKVEILIDGRPNELTKTAGPEIFIHDFILPKEIAKFFFFDAEKIVSLAEINTAEEKRYLSQAYAEVLGIKKYTDLKASLEQMRFRIREKSAVKSDRSTLDKMIKKLEQNQKLLQLKSDRLEEISESVHGKRISSDRYQEQLIREGSAITLEEFKRLKEEKHILSSDLVKIRNRFNDLLELAPFAMLAGKMMEVKAQLELENSNSASALALLQSRYELVANAIKGAKALETISETLTAEILSLVKSNLLPEHTQEVEMLLNFTPDQQQRFFMILEHLRNSYSKTFRSLINDQKRLQTVFYTVNRNLIDAESKGRDPVIADLRKSKDRLDEEIRALESERENLTAAKSQMETESQTISRQVSELTKKVEVEDTDREKDITAERLISKLDQFIQRLKVKKKGSLEKNILTELNSLMHKADFVSRVTVVIEGDLIDIELYDNQSKLIDKELLSKGEQQLYATALLKALVDESNISFPVFIDSPLQKFDKEHSRNIIREFYPNLSAQVVLFPLLEKELNSEEYGWMIDKVGSAYLIRQNNKYNSGFKSVPPDQLFLAYKNLEQHV